MQTTFTTYNRAILSLCFSLFFLNASAAEKDNTPTVSASLAERGPLIRNTSQPASVHPYYEAELASRVTGYVQSVNVDIGDQVKEGDILAIVSAPEIKTQAERKEAEIVFLGFKTKQLEAGTQAVTAETHAEELEYKRISRLASTGAITARAGDEAKSRLEGARAKMAVVLAEVESSRAAVQVAQKELEELQTMLGFANLRAPFAGTITHRDLDPGDLVKSTNSGKNETPLFRVARLDKVRVKVSIPELDSVYVDKGDTGAFTCRALKGRVFDCEVSRTAGSIDITSGSMLVELDIDNPDRKLIPGLFGSATIELERFENAIILPATSVHFDEKGGNVRVYIVSDGAVKVVPVETGYDDGARIQILKGLSGNEKVISGMLGRFSGGEKVTVKTPEPATK